MTDDATDDATDAVPGDGPDLDLTGADLALLESLWQGAAVPFAFDPDKHPRGERGQWAKIESADAAGKEWLAATAGAWAAGLDHDETAHLQRYKGDAFFPINKLLRDPDWPTSPDEQQAYGTRAKAAETFGDHLAGLDSSLAKAVIDRPVVVHRGVSASAAGLVGAFDAGALPPGTEFTDAGYGSTSLSAKAATSFKKGWGRSGPGAVLHIALSPGDRAAHLGYEVEARYAAVRGRRVPDRGEVQDVEHEVLLPRNTTFRVLRTYTSGGVRHIDCAVARQDPPPPAAFYDPDQARAADGRWGGGSGAASADGADAADYRQNGTRARAFKAWFGDSQVVDETTGEPLVVYHGTKAPFDAFDPDRRGSNKGDGGVLGAGFYFGVTHAHAANYGPSVGRYYVRLRNPYRGHWSKDRELSKAVGWGGGPLAMQKRATEILKARGHDGVIARQFNDPAGPLEVVAFDPDQIKSADNAGTFDPGTTSTRFAAFYDPDQPRDAHGRFGPGGGGDGGNGGNGGNGPADADMERLFQTFNGALPYEEKKAIADYVGPYYQQINSVLRKSPDDMKGADWHTRNMIETLDAALAKFPPHAPQTSWRGVKVAGERRWAAMKAGFEAAHATGDPVKLDGFTSASLSRAFAGRWASRAVLVITSPRGAYLGDADSPDEREVLHRHGERFRVTAIRDEAYPTAAGETTRPTYYLEAVPDAPPPIPRTTGVAEYGWDEGQPRDDHGRWAAAAGAGSAAGAPPDPPGTPAVAPSVLDTLESHYHEAAAKGEAATEAELERWRYGLATYDRHTLADLATRIGVPAGGDVVAGIVNSLYGRIGRPVPHPGDNVESREKLAAVRARIALGATDPDTRYEMNRWFRQEADGDQVRWLADQLGVPHTAATPSRDLAVEVVNRFHDGVRHPGEQAALHRGLHADLAATLAKRTVLPVSPEWADQKLRAAGPAATDYLAKTLGLHTPGMGTDDQRRAVADAVRAATADVGRSPASETRLAALRARGGAPVTDFRDREAMRADLLQLSYQSQQFVHRNLGLLRGRTESPSGRACVNEIVSHFTPPVAARITADAKSREIVATVVAEYEAAERLRTAVGDTLQAMGNNIGQYYADRAAAGPHGSPERAAFEAVRRPEFDRLNAEADALMDKLKVDVTDNRARLAELMAPERPAAWTVRHKKSTPEQKTAMAAGLAFLGSVLSAPADAPAGPLAAVTLAPTKTRARARPDAPVKGGAAGTVWLQSGCVATAVHEMGHQIEFHVPGVAAAARDFLAHRVGDEPLQSLKTLFKDHGFRPDEKGRQDDFGRYFGAGDHRAYYCGKGYADGSTEIVSMGVETLFRDPVGFCRKDPEYAQFIIGILRGSLR